MDEHALSPIGTQHADVVKRIDQLLDDPSAREMLAYVTREYTFQLEHTIQDCKALLTPPNVTFLLDFDVLHTYIERRTPSSSDTVCVDFLLTTCDQSYALPIGAFQELADWLGRSAHKDSELALLSASAERLSPEHLRQLLLESSPDGAPETSLLEDLTRRLEAQAVQYERLRSFLSSPRFQGVVLGHQGDDVRAIARFLGETRPPTPYPHSRRDHRDALNLAVLLNAVRRTRDAATTGQHVTGYLLVTRTRAVRDFGTRRTDDHDSSSPHLHDADPTRGQPLPVMRPAEVARAHILGFFHDPGPSLMAAIRMRNLFQQVADNIDLETHARTLATSRPALRDQLPTRLRQQRVRVAEGLQSLAEAFLQPGSPFNVLEAHRATEISVQALRASQLDRPTDSWESLRLKSISFLRTLSDLRRLLTDSVSIEYDLIWADTAQSTFQIRTSVSGVSLGTLIAGDVTFDNVANQATYSMKWPTVVGDALFWQGVLEIAPSSADHEDGSAAAFAPETEDQAVNGGKLVVHTSAGRYSTSLSACLKLLAENKMSMGALSRQLAGVLPNGTPHSAEIERIELVVSDSLRIAFDVVPQAGHTERHIGIRASRDLPIFEKLYARTSTILADSSSVAQRLEQLEAAVNARYGLQPRTAGPVQTAPDNTSGTSPSSEDTSVRQIIEASVRFETTRQADVSEVSLEVKARALGFLGTEPQNVLMRALLDSMLSLSRSEPSVSGARYSDALVEHHMTGVVQSADHESASMQSRNTVHHRERERISVKKHVFISYCRDNADAVRALRQDLLNSGEKIWWDQDILPGQDWKFEIRKAMRDAYGVVLCLSGESVARVTSGLYPEAADAIAAYREYAPGSVFLIPVRLSKCDIPQVEIDGTRTLDRLQYVDLFPASKRPAGLSLLLRALKASPHHP